jgi:glycolate oxidase FAD binding subunit
LTIGETLLGNWSGPFRLFYGAARDMVIGVRFATAEGKLIKSGGKVVKNVAGYDLAKVLIGSQGTLAVLVQANFKLFPVPAASETMALGFPTAAAALAARNAILKSVLTPLALDLLDSNAARFVSPQELPPGEWILAVAYGGVGPVIERYRRDLEEIGKEAGRTASAALSGQDERRLWAAITDMPLEMEQRHPAALRLKVTSTIAGTGACLAAVPAGAVVSRAGTGVSYLYAEARDPAAWVAAARRALDPFEASAVVEHSPVPVDRWGPTGDDLSMMRQLKQTFDPNGILHPGTFVGGL